jgi:hypothetical protein
MSPFRRESVFPYITASAMAAGQERMTPHHEQ